MLLRFVIPEHEWGLLYRNGRLVEWLSPGQHRRFAFFQSCDLRRYDARTPVSPCTPELARLVPDSAAQEVFDVAKGGLGLVIRNGVPEQFLEPGRYLVWRTKAKLELRLVCVDDVPREAWTGDGNPFRWTESVEGMRFERALLYLDGVLTGLVRPGPRPTSQRPAEGQGHVVQAGWTPAKPGLPMLEPLAGFAHAPVVSVE